MNMVSRDADQVWVRRVLSGAAGVVFVMLAAGGFFKGTLGWGQLIAVTALLGSVATLVPIIGGRPARSQVHRICYGALLLVSVHIFSQILGPPIGSEILVLNHLVIGAVCLTQARRTALITTGVSLALWLVLWDSLGASTLHLMLTGIMAGGALRLKGQVSPEPVSSFSDVTPEHGPTDVDLTLAAAICVDDSIRTSLRLLHTGLGCDNISPRARADCTRSQIRRWSAPHWALPQCPPPVDASQV